MSWLDNVQSDVGVIHSLDFYEGCVETMFQTNQIDVNEYDLRKKQIKIADLRNQLSLYESKLECICKNSIMGTHWSSKVAGIKREIELLERMK